MGNTLIFSIITSIFFTYWKSAPKISVSSKISDYQKTSEQWNPSCRTQCVCLVCVLIV